MNNNFSYEENEKILASYIEECRNRIKNTFFSEEELKIGTSIKKDLVNQGIITPNTKTEEALKIHRNNLIDIKIKSYNAYCRRCYKNGTKNGIEC